MTKERLFEPRLGRMRARGARHPTFVAQALRAAAKAGYIGRTRVRAVGGRALGRAAALSTRLRSPARRVVVKARVVRHAGRRFRAAPLAAHLAYLQRDGVDRSGAPGEMFGRDGPVDARAFAARCEDDRHHFRFMISPEDAEQMSDLRAFARELMSTAERDLGTRLDWIAADHWNTAHPHLHLELRATPASYMAQVSWRYAPETLVALQAPAAGTPAVRTAAAPAPLDLARLHFAYRIEGEAPWRPIRVFDDGRRVAIDFPPGASELPPLYRVSPAGALELVNYRVEGRRMVVDRLFEAAELRMGDQKSQARVRLERLP